MESQQNHFVLAKFLDTNEIEVITTEWLRENGTKCYWPNYRSSNTTIKAIGQHKKVEKNWLIHDVKIVGGGRQFGKKYNLKCFSILFYFN